MTFDLPGDEEEQRRSSVAAHRRLVEAIADGDADRASGGMRAHLAEAQEVLVEALGPTVIELTTTPVANPTSDG